MDDSASHPLYKPIDWDKSILAMHDTAYRQAEKWTGHFVDRNPVPAGGPDWAAHDVHVPHANGTTTRSPVERNPPVDLTNVDSVNPDHQPELVFEQWHDGKPPPSTTELSRNADFPCGVPDCDKAFVRRSDLYRHLKSHQSGPRTYNCLADGCPRRGMKGFWRQDKLKDHLDRKHSEIEVERYFTLDGGYFAHLTKRGYRDVAKRGEHEAVMRSKGFEPYTENPHIFHRAGRMPRSPLLINGPGGRILHLLEFMVAQNEPK
ncbi:MAG: hypothetical protein Q9172_007760 [Xanthocarpia lactea]